MGVVLEGGLVVDDMVAGGLVIGQRVGKMRGEVRGER